MTAHAGVGAFRDSLTLSNAQTLTHTHRNRKQVPGGRNGMQRIVARWRKGLKKKTVEERKPDLGTEENRNGSDG